MLTKTVSASGCDWVSGKPLSAGDKVTAKTRYRQQDQACEVINVDDDVLTVRFEQPQRAVTPGQALVFYSGRRCLGGATIQSSV